VLNEIGEHIEFFPFRGAWRGIHECVGGFLVG
jgi:hypothetical protein